MSTENVQNIGASQEAVVAQDNTNELSFTEKAKDVATKVVFGTIATAATVSAVACATYRVVKLIRFIRGDEK